MSCSAPLPCAANPLHAPRPDGGAPRRPAARHHTVRGSRRACGKGLPHINEGLKRDGELMCVGVVMKCLVRGERGGTVGLDENIPTPACAVHAVTCRTLLDIAEVPDLLVGRDSRRPRRIELALVHDATVFETLHVKLAHTYLLLSVRYSSSFSDESRATPRTTRHCNLSRSADLESRGLAGFCPTPSRSPQGSETRN